MKTIAQLSRRERQVIRLIARGRSNREISDALKIKESTANNHVARAYRAIGLHSRAHIVVYALKNGLVRLDDIELPGKAEKGKE